MLCSLHYVSLLLSGTRHELTERVRRGRWVWCRPRPGTPDISAAHWHGRVAGVEAGLSSARLNRKTAVHQCPPLGCRCLGVRSRSAQSAQQQTWPHGSIITERGCSMQTTHSRLSGNSGHAPCTAPCSTSSTCISFSLNL